MKVEKEVNGDLPEDERIRIVQSGLLTIAREHFRLHVAFYESRSKSSQRWNSEWNIELHVKRGRRQNHRADRRGVIVDPGCDGNGSGDVREHKHVFERDAETLRNIKRQGVPIFDDVVKRLC